MKRVIRAICTVMVFAVFSSCTSKLDEKAYIKWVKDFDNGLHVQKEIGDFNFDLQYTPLDYVWLQYKRGPREELSGLQYYTLTISPTDRNQDLIEFNVRDESEKQRRLYYFSYLFQKDLQLEEKGHSMPCVLYHFERPADIKNGRTFMLGFKSDSTEASEAKLIIESEYFGSLPVKIKFSKNNIPELAL